MLLDICDLAGRRIYAREFPNIGVINKQNRLVDVDGDGKVDIVSLIGAKSVVCPNISKDGTYAFGEAVIGKLKWRI